MQLPLRSVTEIFMQTENTLMNVSRLGRKSVALSLGTHGS